MPSGRSTGRWPLRPALHREDPRTSYHVYLDLLSLEQHQRQHLDHAVFYVASALFSVEFLIVSSMDTTTARSFVYHRRINETAQPRTTIVVAHYAHHYELVDTGYDSKQTGEAIDRLIKLPRLHPRGRHVDRDYARWQKSGCAEACAGSDVVSAPTIRVRTEAGERKDEDPIEFDAANPARRDTLPFTVMRQLSPAAAALGDASLIVDPQSQSPKHSLHSDSVDATPLSSASKKRKASWREVTRLAQ